MDCFSKMPEKIFTDAPKIVFVANKLKSQGMYGRSEKAITVEPTGMEFRFISPHEIIENISHSWEPYENTSSAIAEKFKSFTEGIHTGKGLVKGTVDAIETAGSSLKAFISAGEVAYTRIDTPLIYRNSERRKYDFTFQMGFWEDAYTEMMEPIRKLEELSSPGKKGDDAYELNPPYIFTIRTEPAGLLWVSYAALVNVQPTYRGPYTDKGFPSSCELHLSFQDLEPLFNEMFTKDNMTSQKLVTESGTPEAKANTQPAVAPSAGPQQNAAREMLKGQVSPRVQKFLDSQKQQ